MGRYRYPERPFEPCEVDQHYKTLHETLDEYLKTGVLDTPSNDESYDFKSGDDVDLRAELPHDVDLYDAAAGVSDPFDNINITPNEPISSTPSSEPSSTPSSEPSSTPSTTD